MSARGWRLAAAGLALAALCSARAPAASDAAVQAPTLRVDDTWVYRFTENDQTTPLMQRVTGVDADGYRLESQEIDFGGFQRVRLDRQLNLLEREVGAHRLVSFTPFYPYFHFPLEPGAEWSGEVAIRHNWETGYQLDRNLRFRVVGWEEVRVPAGIFHALRIEGEGRNSGRIGERELHGRVHERLWYAPAVRNVVRREFDEPAATGGRHKLTWELLEHHLQP